MHGRQDISGLTAEYWYYYCVSVCDTGMNVTTLEDGPDARQACGFNWRLDH